MNAKEKIFFPNLDGLRFFCFLSVFCFHSFFTDIPSIKSDPVYHFIKKSLVENGNIGVNFFFVLSGFLITFLLIKEKVEYGHIHIFNFWMRRILRIWPLYFLCVLFGFEIFPLLKAFFGQTPNETAHLWNYLTFTSNFDMIRMGSPDASNLSVLWSVAIEEQFYFIWPLLLSFIPVRRYPVLFIGIIAGTLIFRACNEDYMVTQYHTFSCIGDMAVGALGAYIVQSMKWKRKIESLKKIQILGIYLCFFIVYFFNKEILLSNSVVAIFDRLIIAILILFIILEQNYAQNSFFKVSRLKMISKLGIISYGLYCLHFIGILITLNCTKLIHLNNTIWGVMIAEFLGSLAVTILLSKISYQFFEIRFLKLKNRFSYFTKE